MPNEEEREGRGSWGPFSECRFIDGLGTWRHPGKRVELTPVQQRRWLEKYIEVHQNSKRNHHLEGVKYAREKLEVLNAGM